MFCPNCGKQLPEGTKFCNQCGTPQPFAGNQTSAPEPQPYTAQQPSQQQPPVQQQQPPVQQPVFTAQQPQRPQKQKKKTGVTIVSILVVIAAFLLGKFVIAPALLSDSGKDSSQDKTSSSDSVVSGDSSWDAEQDGSEPAQTDTSSADYDAIFEGTYIVHMPMFFNMDTASFATKSSDGTITCYDYGYQDDMVIQLVETTYIPIADATDAQKAELENKAIETANTYAGVENLTVEYQMGNNYFSVKVTYADLDQPEGREALAEAGILAGDSPISMKASEEQQLANGAVKK